MRATKAALIVLLCLFILASASAGCVTTNNGNAARIGRTAVTGRVATNSSVMNKSSSAPTRYQVVVANVTVYAEAANTPLQRQQGLMHRTSLDANAGMLFVFPREERESFWMKNTLIPLDIIFITADLRVLEIYRSVPPCAGVLCPFYTS
ncbi:MAG TPA: DUF192 domain-containing protein, partial [Candidatus Acidoferrales bacterium]|nr:DUF192 domain-containing protein [Candidatus Acidoferrales bacterium]